MSTIIETYPNSIEVESIVQPIDVHVQHSSIELQLTQDVLNIILNSSPIVISTQLTHIDLAISNPAINITLSQLATQDIEGVNIPPGGTEGQVLTKQSAENYDVQWQSVSQSGCVWGSITGTLASQSDLQLALNLKYDAGNPDGFISDISAFNTDDLQEGSTNRYYTDARAQAAVSGLYVALTGNETIAGVKAFSSFPILPSSTATGNQAVTANQLEEAVSVEKFRRGFVIDVLINAPPSSPSTGDRYVVGESPSGAWVGQADAIAEWNGSVWTFITAEEGFTVTVKSSFVDYTYNDLSAWVPSGGNTIYSASDGILLDGSNFEIDFASTYPGLEIADGGLRAKVDGTSIERMAEGLSVKNVPATLLTGQVATSQGGTGLSALGAANRVLGVNGAANAMEYKAIVAGSNVSIINTAGQIEISSALNGAADFLYTSESFYADPGVNFVWTNLPALLTIGSTYLRKKVNLTGATQFRIVVNQAVAGTTLSKLRVQYSGDNVNFFPLDVDASGDLTVGNGTGVKVGAWTDIVAGAKTDVWLQFYALGGDGVADPAFRQIDVQLRYNSTIVEGDATGIVARELIIHSHPSSVITWTNMPAALTEFLGTTSGRRRADLTGCTHYRIAVNQSVAGFAGADINLQYSTTSQSTGYIAADTNGAGELDIGAGIGVKIGPWAPLVNGAKGDVWLRLVGKDGNAVVDPAWSHIVVQFKSSVFAQTVGTNTQVIFNDGGVSAGNADFTFDKTTGTLSATAFVGDGSGLTGVGGAVDSVNGQTGVVVIDTDDISEGTTNKYNVQSDWNAVFGLAQILNKPTLASVAISGDYGDINNPPTLGSIAALNTINLAADVTGSLPDENIASAVIWSAKQNAITNGVDQLSNSEVDQLKNIGATAISSTQWGYIGGLDQSLTTTSNVDYNNANFGGNVTIAGNLTVLGNSFVVESETVEVADNVLLINSGELGAGVTTGVAGIEIDRGSATHYQFMFVESDDSFKIGQVGSLQKVATREDAPIDTGVAVWNSTASRFDTTINPQFSSVQATGNVTVGGIYTSVDSLTLSSGSGYFGYGGSTSANYTHEFYGPIYSDNIIITDSGFYGSAIGLVSGTVSRAALANGTPLSLMGRSANTAGAVTDIAAGADFNIMRRSGTAIGFGTIDLSQSGAVGTSRLGFANLAQGSALSVLGVTGNATANNASITAGADFNVLRRSGTAIGFGAIDLSQSGAVGTSRLGFANLAQGSALSVLGVTGNATANNASIAATSDHQVLRRSGTAIGFGSINLAQAAAVTGVLGVANGGTSLSTFSAASRIPFSTSATALATNANFTFDGNIFTVSSSDVLGGIVAINSNVAGNAIVARCDNIPLRLANAALTEVTDCYLNSIVNRRLAGSTATYDFITTTLSGSFSGVGGNFRFLPNNVETFSLAKLGQAKITTATTIAAPALYIDQNDDGEALIRFDGNVTSDSAFSGSVSTRGAGASSGAVAGPNNANWTFSRMVKVVENGTVYAIPLFASTGA